MSRNAVMLVDKGEGMTSFSCLGRIKHNINRKAGHCGTLDKFAHGLLIVLCGCYTHLVPLFMDMDKTYEATIRFGSMTDTLDPEGEVVETSDHIPTAREVHEAVEKLTGPIMQIPPIYSAIHVNGKRAYNLARSGKAADEYLPARPVTILGAEVLSYEAPLLRIRLHVSKGTYIRSYARDLGHLCSSCAYVTELYRTHIGPFSVSEAFRYDDEAAMKAFAGTEHLISRIPGTVELEMTKAECFKARNGFVMETIRTRIAENSRFAVLKHEGGIVCIYSVPDGKIICQVANGD